MLIQKPARLSSISNAICALSSSDIAIWPIVLDLGKVASVSAAEFSIYPTIG